MSKKKFYAVVKGRKPGIYTEWYGEDGADAQVNEFPGAIYKGFAIRADAEAWFNSAIDTETLESTISEGSKEQVAAGNEVPPTTDDVNKVIVYTDGGCIGNPGPGGYGVVILSNGQRQELSGGYRWTTNNRMELMGCITALERLEHPSDVVIHTDSQYVVNGIMQGWALNWRSRGWRKSDGQQAENIDLWQKLLDLCEKHRVEFNWVRGHAGNKENERCDVLSMRAANRKDLPNDPGY